MFPSPVLFCLAALVQWVHSFPQVFPRGAGDFSLDAVYSFPLASRLERRDGEVKGSGPVASFTVGGQKLVGLLDAGAGYLTTRNVSQYTGTSDKNGYYEISKSSTVKTIAGASWSECFNDGCDGGPVVKDNVILGTVHASQALIMACDNSCKGSGSNFGMGRGLTTTYQQNGKTVTGPSFFGTISSGLSLPIWSLTLTDGVGTFDFGYVNNTKRSGAIGGVDIDTTGNWQANVTGYSFSNGGGSSSTTVLRFALDTGDSEMGLPPDIITTYFKAVPGSVYDSSGNYHFPCSATLPDFTITVGGQKVTVAGKNFVGGVVSGSTCWSSLVAGGDGNNVNTWGLPFLQGVFTLFSYAHDGEPDRLGFANKAT